MQLMATEFTLSKYAISGTTVALLCLSKIRVQYELRQAVFVAFSSTVYDNPASPNCHVHYKSFSTFMCAFVHPHLLF